MNWLFYFMFNFVLYSFLGWCLEEIYSYFTLGFFKKEGFLRGPFKPMYGTAMAILIYLYESLNFSKTAMIIFFIAIPTVIEYISGYLLKKYFGKVYWDYNDITYNFQGIICLKFSLAWAVLSAFVVFFIQPILNVVYVYYESFFNYLSLLLLIYIVINFIETVFKIYNDKKEKALQ